MTTLKNHFLINYGNLKSQTLKSLSRDRLRCSSSV